MSDDQDGSHRDPPRSHRFKPGQTGNPRGRPRGTRNLWTNLTQLLNKRINRMNVHKNARLLRGLEERKRQRHGKCKTLGLTVSSPSSPPRKRTRHSKGAVYPWRRRHAKIDGLLPRAGADRQQPDLRALT